ncbi:hypothetical protein DDE74_01165 [Streptomyces lydicus]|uniref:Uncharacterized protein n=1 Tax=Streptomyces lydicus TaxID=47763 RepID=A0A3S9YME1_9ACTN|nr:hypothetical protein DDE74_01165 [Streptomyces lydicus]
MPWTDGRCPAARRAPGCAGPRAGRPSVSAGRRPDGSPAVGRRSARRRSAPGSRRRCRLRGSAARRRRRSRCRWRPHCA